MGTSTARSSSNDSYFTMGNLIPGMKMDGMNVFAVREGMKMVKDFCRNGNGPMYVEMNTYRYHGHSMSDPGNTYRTKDDVSKVRQTKDPIAFVKNTILEHSFLSEQEVKEIEKEVKKAVEAEVKLAKAMPEPTTTDLTNNIYTEGRPAFIRMPDYTKSIVS